jgi:hypothetical protein
MDKSAAPGPKVLPWLMDGLRLGGKGLKAMGRGAGNLFTKARGTKVNPKALAAGVGIPAGAYGLRELTNAKARETDLKDNAMFDLGVPDYAQQYLQSPGGTAQPAGGGKSDNIFLPPSVFGSTASQLPTTNSGLVSGPNGRVTVPNANLDALNKRRGELDNQIKAMQTQIAGVQGTDLNSILEKERLSTALGGLTNERNSILGSVGGTVSKLQGDQTAMQNRSGDVINAQTKILAERQAQADRLARLLSGQERRGWFENLWTPQTRQDQVQQAQRLLTEIERRRALVRQAEGVRSNLQLVDPAWTAPTN